MYDGVIANMLLPRYHGVTVGHVLMVSPQASLQLVIMVIQQNLLSCFCGRRTSSGLVITCHSRTCYHMSQSDLLSMLSQ